MEGEQQKGLSGMAVVLLLFLVVFPKGGVKVANVPLTWGLLLLAISAFYCLLRNLVINCPISLSRATAYLATLAFPCLATVTLATQGYDEFGYVISLYT